MHHPLYTKLGSTQASTKSLTASASSSLRSLADRAALVHRAGGLARSVGVEVVECLVNNLPRDVNVAGEACVAVELTEDGVAEIQSRGAVRVPDSVGAGASAASLTSITNKQREVRRDAIGSDNNSLSTVLGKVASNLRVVHSNDVVAVNFIERKARQKVAFDKAQVLVGETGTAGLYLLNVVVVGSKSSSAVNNSLGESRSGKEADGSKNLTLHLCDI